MKEIARKGFIRSVFKNEFGNQIVIEISRADVRNTEGVLIKVRSFFSESTNLLTEMEFNYLMEAATKYCMDGP